MKYLLIPGLFVCILCPFLWAADNQTDADNTARNQRDRTHETVTPQDQSNSPEDLKTTQAIRQALVKDDALSTTAKNVKVITANGKVTLRGPVNSADEKSRIEKTAKAAAGKAELTSQLEVKANR